MSDRHPATADAMPTTRGLNFYREDPNLEFVCSTVIDADGLAAARPHLLAMGEVAGGELDRLAAVADRNPPALRAWNERGDRIDEVLLHPAYVDMERIAFERFGLAAMSHVPGVLGWRGRVPHVVKYALSYVFAQSEFGLLCPVSMTDSAARMLRHYGSEALKDRYLPGLTAQRLAELCQGAQWMTEKTGGSDVGAATTVARPTADGRWRLYGDKWFCSNANAEIVLTLARPEGAPPGTSGLGMFLVPKRLPDGTRNAWTINRLKDKLGSRSMATGEVTYAGAVADVVGELDRGFLQMMEMVNVSRLSNAMRAAGIMRRCLLDSAVHARGRAGFGARLIDLPLLRESLLQLVLDTEAAASVVLNGAAMLDRWDGGSDVDRRLFRIVTPLAKHWITARARAVAGEAMNVRGGNGYVEEWVNPRLLRDSVLGSIWEGSSNVVALDVQRAILRDGCAEPLLAFISARLDAVVEPAAKPAVDTVRRVTTELERTIAGWPALPRPERELGARGVTETLYHALAASLLLAEGQIHQGRSGSVRKLLVATLYVKRWLTAREPHVTALPWAAVQRLDDLIDWSPVAVEALSEVA